MARYRRYRRTIVRAPKKKWGSNIINISSQISNTTGQIANGFHYIVLAQNKTETTVPTPVIIKTGNFKLQGDLYFSYTATGGTQVVATLYILYIPQGMEPQTANGAETLVQNHPEWIMAWKVLEGGATLGNRSLDSNRFTVTSRLKRNLNSGDSVISLLIVENLNTDHTVFLKGKCQFWTCAN